MEIAEMNRPHRLRASAFAGIAAARGVLLAVCWLASSCGGGDGGGPPRVVPPRAWVLPGASQQFDVDGSTATATWSVKYDRSAGSRIDASGLYTAGQQANVCDVVQAGLSSGEWLTATVYVTMTPLEPLVLDADYLEVVTGAVHQFTVTGGTAPYSWAMPASETGGVLEESGLYHAGQTPGTDVVQVTDASGQGAQATVTVAQSPPPEPDCKCGGPLGGPLAAVPLLLLLRRRRRRAVQDGAVVGRLRATGRAR